MRRSAATLNALAAVWAAAATLYLLSAAGYRVVSTSSAVAGEDAGVGHLAVSLVSASGPWIVALLFVVTLTAALPFGVALAYPAGQRVTTWTCALSLLGFSLVAGFSVGLPYLPPALVLVASALVTPAAGAMTPPPVREHRGSV